MSSAKSLSRAGGKLGICVLGAIAACTLAGCTGVGATTDSRKGLLDPTAVGRFQKQPLVVPILSSLERNIDVADERFRDATDVTPADLDPSTMDYAIGRNDLVSVSITDLVAPNVETMKTVRVSESGMISLPLVGQVKAAGLTEAQLEQEIAKAYRQANVIQNAQVSVSVTEARARSFSILGAVAFPGQYAILNAEFRVLDALVLARDVPQPTGIDYIYIVRQLQPRQNAPVTPAKPEAPTTTEDVLTPRSDSGEAVQPIMAQAAPTTTGISGNLGEEQRIVTVEGNPVAVSTAATAPAAPAAAPPTVPAPSPVAPAAAPVAEGETLPPVATRPAVDLGEFEFREPVASGKQRVIRVPFEALRNGDLRYNVIVKPYDLIIVPQPVVGEYYMGGHVARVGVYSLTARKITLKQAIVGAGMFDQLAVPAQTDVIRRVGGDHEIFVKVDLDKVFEGSQPDVYLKPNDEVLVGTSWWAPFAAALRGGVRFTYGFGFLYDRNFASTEDQFGLGGRARGPNVIGR